MAAFLARISDHGSTSTRLIPEAGTPLEAAIQFAERWDGLDLAGEVSVTVTDGETGAQHCFRIDLGEHTAEPC